MTEPPRDGESGIRDLLPAVARGEAAATDAFFRWEHPHVYRLCLGLLADAHDADDAAQDAMLHLIDHLDRYEPRRPWRAWRNAVVVNLCRDRMRRGKTRVRHEEGAADALLPARLPSPEDAASAAEVRAALEASLAALTPREREAFVLRDLQGAPTDEVAQTLDVTPATVRSLLTLARRRLRGLLARRVPGALPEGAS